MTLCGKMNEITNEIKLRNCKQLRAQIRAIDIAFSKTDDFAPPAHPHRHFTFAFVGANCWCLKRNVRSTGAALGSQCIGAGISDCQMVGGGDQGTSGARPQGVGRVHLIAESSSVSRYYFLTTHAGEKLLCRCRSDCFSGMSSYSYKKGKVWNRL